MPAHGVVLVQHVRVARARADRHLILDPEIEPVLPRLRRDRLPDLLEEPYFLLLLIVLELSWCRRGVREQRTRPALDPWNQVSG